ncbi:MAG TPA: hypothetical protein VFL88_03395 [Gemmatimonadales bacterium]|nr:hypothetical protein [Gemmatimonadales bacterium]
MPQVPRLPPFHIHSIAFAYPGNRDAIALRAPATDRLLSEHAEWIRQERSAPAAYVRGARPHIRVVFRRERGPSKVTAVIGARATGNAVDIEPRRVRLAFGRNGLSRPVLFRLSRALSKRVGVRRIRWRWSGELEGARVPLGDSEHEICLTWRRPRPAAPWASNDAFSGHPVWVYAPVMQWTCAWAAGRNDAKAICDAILSHLPASGLAYAKPAWDVRSMLSVGGGYCGGWYRMFQAMAAAQGIQVERRSFLVDWQNESGGRARWCAIVVRKPGINRETVAEAASTFHDVRQRPVKEAPVRSTTVPRYRFWGVPGKVGDGHCVNFLRHSGRWYLYDACFMSRAVALPGFSLPRSDSTRAIPIGKLGAFRTGYLDHAVSYMLGSLRNEGRLFRTVHPDPGDPGYGKESVINGLTIRTPIVPRPGQLISFYWI